MPFILIISLLISSMLFFVSFFTSLTINLWTDALFRSCVVFVLSMIMIYLFYYLWKKTTKEPEEVIEEEMESTNSNAVVSDKDYLKGAHIDIQTPDEDEEFLPFPIGNVSREEQ